MLVWLITGTSSGFGKALVKEVLSRGDHVIATARNLQHLSELGKSERLHGVELDLFWDSERINATIKAAINHWGHVDVLVNNAAHGFKGVMEERGTAGFRDSLQINFFAQIDVTNAVLPQMRERGSGTLVMMGSRSSWTTDNPGTGLYNASKAAFTSYSETLAAEISQFGLRVLILQPAGFITKGLESSIDTEHPIAAYDAMRKEIVAWFDLRSKLVRGDVGKAMKVVTDVVRGEGKAKGRGWPLYLLLGDQALPAVKAKCDKVVTVAEEWKDVTANLDVDEVVLNN